MVMADQLPTCDLAADWTTVADLAQAATERMVWVVRDELVLENRLEAPDELVLAKHLDYRQTQTSTDWLIKLTFYIPNKQSFGLLFKKLNLTQRKQATNK